MQVHVYVIFFILRTANSRWYCLYLLFHTVALRSSNFDVVRSQHIFVLPAFEKLNKFCLTMKTSRYKLLFQY